MSKTEDLRGLFKSYTGKTEIVETMSGKKYDQPHRYKVLPKPALFFIKLSTLTNLILIYIFILVLKGHLEDIIMTKGDRTNLLRELMELGLIDEKGTKIVTSRTKGRVETLIEKESAAKALHDNPIIGSLEVREQTRIARESVSRIHVLGEPLYQ